MPPADEDLDRIHAALAQADRALVDALDARARAVQDWIALRERQPDTYLTLGRDADIVARAREQAQTFPREAIAPVYREVLAACASMLAPIDVVYLGVAGGIGHTAARMHFGAVVTLRPLATTAEIVSEVERGRASMGVLPWETSNDGVVTQTLNLLACSEAKLSAEVTVASSYHLLSRAERSEDVQRIYGTPSAVAAVEGHLRAGYPAAQVFDTATGLIAAERAQSDPHAAAVGTEVVAELSGLPTLQAAIEDRRDREIRYAVISRDYPPRSGHDRTAIAVGLHDAPGVLYACLQPLANRNLNVSRLETRPATDLPWRYLILVEIDGHITDRPVLTAVEEMRAANRYVKVLGSYPRPS